MNHGAIVIILLAFVIFFTANSGIVQFADAFIHILSPSKDETVPAGSSLEISGTSDDNPQFNCKVMVLVNDKRPYQETTPVAPGDYSEWTYTLNPQYAEIDQGINTITSKASCDAPYESFLKLDPISREYVKFYSVNVTGIPSSTGVGSDEPLVFGVPGEGSGDEGSSGDGSGGSSGDGSGGSSGDGSGDDGSAGG